VSGSKPLAAVGVAALLTLSLLAGIGGVAAQESGGQEWEPPGPFPVDELRQGGVHDPDAPPSARMLGDPVRGSAAFRYTPVSPVDSSKKFVESGQLVETDTLEFYSTAFGEASGEYQLVLVYWNEDSKRVNGTQVEYAGDQTVQRIDLEVENGYQTQNIELRSHYDSTKEVTAWLERDGERVEGARWRFQHRSNPLTASPAYPIDTRGDAWRWAGVNFFLPAIPGILVGRRTAQHVLSRTIVGPQKGGLWWTFVLGFLTLAAVAVGTWQTAAVLARAPYVAGIFVCLFSFVAFLGFRDQEVEKAEFNQKDLESVTSVSGDETKQARNEHIELIDIIRRDGNIYAPSPGLRPFFARYWANPAAVDESDLKTVNNTTGDVSKKYELDPPSDEPLVRQPATLSFQPQLTVDEEPDPVFDADEADNRALSAAHQTVNSVAGGLGSLNLAFLGPALIGGAIMYYAVHAWVGVPSLAGIAACLPAVVAGYSAKDGAMEIDEAPYHFSEARAVLAYERQKYEEASTFEELQEKVLKSEMGGLEQVQNLIESHWQNQTERFERLHGLGDADKDTDDSESRPRPRRQQSTEADD